MNTRLIKVLIVDDSALIRALLTDILESDARLCVVAAASDPYEARELIKRHNPDVLTLDIEMPKMNGISFLKNLMRLRPMPVVMISTLTQQGAPATLEALALGAVDFIAKPKTEGAAALEQYRKLIVEKVVCAARANMQAAEVTLKSQATLDQRVYSPAHRHLRPTFICALGASTGGTEAIKYVVSSLPENSPPMVITQHIPAGFSTSFAQRVNACSAVRVYEAEHEQRIEMGSVYIAPGHSHLRVEQRGGFRVCLLGQDESVNRHRPSVSVLFDSVLHAAGGNAIGILLTGMGADGADALLRMRNAGCVTVAQDEDTSVVWGMPGAAVKLGAASQVLPLQQVAKFIISEAYK